MLSPDFDPQPAAVRIYRIGYVSRCKKPRCPAAATLVAEKIDTAGRHVRQIELRDRHAEIVIDRERVRGLEINDRRDWRGKRERASAWLFEGEGVALARCC